MKEFADRLKSLRIAQDLSQTDFAKKVNLTQAAISQLENGEREPSFATLEKIADGLGLSLDDLVANQNSAVDYDKEFAIQALVAKLKSASVSTEAVIALSRFIEAIAP